MTGNVSGRTYKGKPNERTASCPTDRNDIIIKQYTAASETVCYKSTFKSGKNTTGSAATLYPAFRSSDAINKARIRGKTYQIPHKPTFLRINMAAPWRAQIRIRRRREEEESASFVWNKYWKNHQMEPTDGSIYTFSSFF